MQASPIALSNVPRNLHLQAGAAQAPAGLPAAGLSGAMTPVLCLRDVGVGEASLNLSAYAGEIVHLGGGSPTARLRVLAMAAGFGPCGSGHCEVLGHDLHELGEAQRRLLRERHVARVLACDHLPEAATVLAAVALPLVRQGVALLDARARAELELDALGVAALAARRLDALSRPEVRMVLLARALVTRPRLLVLEEPETELSPTAVSAVRLALWALSSAFGSCVLMSSCHPRLLASADRFVDLDRERGAGRGFRSQAQPGGAFQG
jgi:predicted ABC-type transport system involved in lysophospholipase L1 biosynthesis ATPase subunit